MNTSELLANIDDEISRLRQVRALLAGDGAGKRGGSRPAASFEFGANRTHKRHTMSAAGRARIAAAQKKRWAKLKRNAAAK